MTRPPKLPAAIVRTVREALASHAGLEPRDWVLEARLGERIAALGLEKLDAYAALITSPAGRRELDLLVEVLRVGETRFYRHRSHIKAIEKVVVPALRDGRSPGSKIRAWSAGCATGEEAYTLALVLLRGLGATHSVKITATDISQDALDVARARVYPDTAVANVPASIKQWGFSREGRGWQIADHVAQKVSFETHNLADRSFPRGFDVILCRNVLIYFSPSARESAISKLIDSLRDDGFLFVGYAETLRDFEALCAVQTPDAVLYRKSSRAPEAPKPAAAAPSKNIRPARVLSAPPRGTPLPRKLPPITAEEAVVELRGRYDGTQRLSREVSAAMAGPYRRVVIDLDGAEYLSDDAAAVLKRARSAARAAGVELIIVAERAGTKRWLTRSGLEETS